MDSENTYSEEASCTSHFSFLIYFYFVITLPANAGRKAVFCQRREKHAWRARKRNRLSMTAYGPSRREPVVPLQASPDVHETRTDESDPNLKRIAVSSPIMSAWCPDVSARQWKYPLFANRPAARSRDGQKLHALAGLHVSLRASRSRLPD